MAKAIKDVLIRDAGIKVRYEETVDGSGVFVPLSSTPTIAPADNADVINPSDETDLANPTRGLYVGVSGDVKVDFVTGGTEVVLVGLAAGVVHPLRVKKVYAGGTTATDIMGLY